MPQRSMTPAPASPGASPAPSRRILTVPNLISFARLAGVPVFLWLVLALRTTAGDWWAIGLLIVSGASDWLDGKLARALNQQSELGQLLDPAADRLYIVATVIALAVRAIIGWWLVAVLAARELLMALLLLILRRHGYQALQVSFAGKTATLCLLYAFPLLFLGDHHTFYQGVVRSVGWGFVIWGAALYWCAAGLYAVQTRRLVRADRAGTGAGGTGAGGADASGPDGAARQEGAQA